MQGKWLLIADVDGTLTTEKSIWECFHRKLGKWHSEGLPNLRAFQSGEIDYEEFASRDARAYKGLLRRELAQMAAAIPRRKGMETMLRTMERRGYMIALVSTGLDILLDQIPVATVRIANRLRFANDVCTGEAEVVIPIDGKGHAVAELRSELKISPERIVVLGDSAGDIPMMKLAGFSVAVASSESEVLANASADVSGEDLMRLPALIQDYRDRVDSRKVFDRR